MLTFPRILFCLPILLITITNCDLDCYEMRQENVKHLELKVLETSLEADNFEIIRSQIIKKTNGYIYLSSNLGNSSHKVSSDQTVLMLNDRNNISLLNYADLGEENTFMTQNEFTTLDFSFFSSSNTDISSERNLLIKSSPGIEFYSANEFEQKKYHLLTYDKNFEIVDTLQTIFSKFESPTRFIQREISNPKFSNNSSSITYKIIEYVYSFDTTSTQNNYYENFIEKKYSILQIGENGTLDTLIDSRKNNFNFYTTEKFLFEVGTEETLLYSLSGEYIKSFYIGNVKPSRSGLTFINSNSTNVYYSNSDKKIDISQHSDSTTYSVSNDDYVLLVQRNKYIDIIRLSDNSKYGSITTNKIPDLVLNRDKRSTLLMLLPIFTDNNSIRFLFTDSYYFDDPFDDCEI